MRPRPVRPGPGARAAGAVMALLLAAARPVAAQSLPRVDTRVSPAVIHIGDTLTVEATVTPGLGVDRPGLSDRIGEFEVLGVSRQEAAGAVRLRIHLTTFETGNRTVPPIAIAVRTAGGVDSVRTAPYRVSVESLLPADTTAAETLKARAAHPPLELPRRFRWGTALGYLLALAALAAAGWWAVRKLRQRPAELPAFATSAPAPPPDVAALEALEAISARGYVERGLFKPHYSEITDVVRTYVEGRYHIEALDRTSGELLEDLGATAAGEPHRRILARMLEEADLVKFARFTPEAGPAARYLDDARRFVIDTTAAAELEAVTGPPATGAVAGPKATGTEGA